MNELRYSYEPATGEYTGVSHCHLSPARPQNDDGTPNWLEPAYSTAVAPPEAGEGFVSVWDGTAWKLTENNRGKLIYSIVDGSWTYLAALGPVISGYTLKQPPDAYCVWNGSDWVEDPARWKAKRKAEVNALCAAKIAAGVIVQFPDGPASVQTRNITDMQNILAFAARGLAERVSGSSEVRSFLDADNEPHALTSDQAVAFGAAVQTAIEALYAASRQIKDAIDALPGPDVETVKSYDITKGWPAPAAAPAPNAPTVTS
ncbi:MAG: DUF4376 domain-containing protein [Desulfovibrionaceae bacterium]|nr:DUF4376 domain-containing protein [Desulfovibrionaceae bacterium]MBF0513615.1 DUF4376 domain-containing protein [Desulfovibrionaceae bacterium]